MPHPREEGRRTPVSRARRAAEELLVPEGFRDELIDGRIVLSPVDTARHWRLIALLRRQLESPGPLECVAVQSVRHSRFPDDLPRPDLILLPRRDDPREDDDFFLGDGATFVAEVLGSANPFLEETEKVRLYARWEIPLYLIVDPFGGECVLYARPSSHGYREKRVTAFGEPVALPSPVSVEVDTTGFRAFAGRGGGAGRRGRTGG